MQMLGRAGRPQFDDSAVAVILTRKERVAHYERLVSGTESLESCLHLNLIDHINAEIGLGNVTDLETATKWLAGTFLFVRLRRNPTQYKLKEGASQADEDELLRQICEKDIKLLQGCDLVEMEQLRSTQFGDAMARYYIRFETMKILLSLKSRATVSQIVSLPHIPHYEKKVTRPARRHRPSRRIQRNPSQGRRKIPLPRDQPRPQHSIPDQSRRSSTSPQDLASHPVRTRRHRFPRRRPVPETQVHIPTRQEPRLRPCQPTHQMRD